MWFTLGEKNAAARPALRICTLLACALSVAGAVPAVSLGQFGGAQGTPKVLAQENNPADIAASEESDVSLEAVHAELGRKLADALVWRDRLGQPSSLGVTPKGIGGEEFAERQRLVENLIFYYRAQIRTITELLEAEEARADAVAQNRSWGGIEEPPPYSILLVDQLWDTVEAAEGKVAALESARAVLERGASREDDSLRQAESATRRAAEAVETAGSPRETALATWRREQAELRERVAQNAAALGAWTVSLTTARLAAARAELELFRRKLAEARKNAVFSLADLEKVRETVKEEAADLGHELQAALARSAKRTEEREAAQRRLERTQAAIEKGTKDSVDLEVLEAKLEAAQAGVSTARLESEALNNLIALNRATMEMWEQRYTLVNSENPEKRRAALDQLKFLLERVTPWRSYIQEQLAVVRAEEQKQKARMDSPEIGLEMGRYEQATLEELRARKGVLDRLQGLADRTERSLRRWLSQYQARDQGYSLSTTLVDRWAAFAKTIHRAWEYEVFTVEDAFEVEGRVVKKRRGITFGKSIGALILFVVGYMVAVFLASRVQSILIRRFHIDESVAKVFRRWILVCIKLVLLALILNLLRIPLTAFAFLGGALAIGIGFGTQTLLKNLISGIMVLMERKIKVGDIVELDGVVGTVTEIDIRSSTVRGFDGVETMIPNASFLEKKVSNWTYTSRALRRCVKVGVSYGSSTRRSAELLAECASRHGLVMKEPKPFVWLEDFSDNAILFGLYFWVELVPTVNSYQVMSDLRFMIAEAFAKAGIVIAFPQRDLHFDARQPLQVAVIAPEAPGAKSPTP